MIKPALFMVPALCTGHHFFTLVAYNTVYVEGEALKRFLYNSQPQTLTNCSRSKVHESTICHLVAQFR